MDRNSPYYQQVTLLLRLLPFVAEEKCFALKGGTAINLFVRDLPRLSVDIDLVYLGRGNRSEALAAITEALNRIADAIERALPDVTIARAYQDKPDALRLVVSQRGATVKIELSPVLRGTVYPVDKRAVADAVEREFGFAENQVVSHPDLYAGKICAALDRQHPRDFFDVMLLLKNEGISDELRKAFIVYLASHNRPVEELLAPDWQRIDDMFESEFKGMALRETTVGELRKAAETTHKTLIEGFTDNEKHLLCSLYGEGADWSLLGIAWADDLPAVKWKIENIKNMQTEKRRESQKKLKQILGMEK